MFWWLRKSCDRRVLFTAGHYGKRLEGDGWRWLVYCWLLQMHAFDYKIVPTPRELSDVGDSRRCFSADRWSCLNFGSGCWWGTMMNIVVKMVTHLNVVYNWWQGSTSVCFKYITVNTPKCWLLAVIRTNIFIYLLQKAHYIWILVVIGGGGLQLANESNLNVQYKDVKSMCSHFP